MSSTPRTTGTLLDWEARTLPAPIPVPVRVYRPAPAAHNPASGWLVWAHGGSWQYGSATQWHTVTSTLATLSGWTVVSVDYRLAPRHRHPTALEDVLTALSWTRRRAGTSPVAVGGDSAGGTLAACAALAERDRGRRLAAQLLAYPPLDPDCSSATYRRDLTAFPQAAHLRRAWRTWRGTTSTAQAVDGTTLYSTPFDAPTLVGLAPAVLAVGLTDPVRAEVNEYALRLRAADVPVRLLQPPAAGHGDVLQPGSRLLQQLADALHHLSTAGEGNPL
ncbi:alpha/beta hydrolase [Micromonospora rubida]|uniref:alpha/beta hydrolase n=1 Tax=Micromonospora rubida TaxID=2697657 RepID=UPI001378962A|nr:alpha/beta hydrolase [Micromonospora rubida]NBE83546.1 alpha/beta hydrolase fold domain-containing protein [Micromonospora rubida]